MNSTREFQVKNGQQMEEFKTVKILSVLADLSPVTEITD